MLQSLRMLLPACLGLSSAAEAARNEDGRMIAGQRIQFVRRRFSTIAFHTLLLVSIFVTAAVQATDLPVQGGPGGSNFRRECSGDFVVGVYVRSGDWVDAIGLKCGIFKQTQGEFSQPPWNTPYYGGTSAALQEQELVCAKDRFVSGITFNVTGEASHPFVDFIELTCTPMAGGASNTLCIHTGQGCPPAGAIVQTCPAGEAATGVRGRTGLYVDALGLICGPKPSIMPGGVQHPRPEACPKGDDVPEEWREMLDAHNERRRQHCVPPLTWSNELATGAQAYATQCILDQHGADGENMANAWRESGLPPTPVLPALTDRDAFEQTWYCEVANYDFTNPVFRGGFTTNCQDVNGHFTQVVWRDTCHLGCGRAPCTINGHQGTHWVCRYDPPGNVNTGDVAVLRQQVFPRECQ
jgi:hypothetical protein